MSGPIEVTRGTIDDAPLDALFPRADAADTQRMRRTAAVLDSARPPGQSPVCEWFPGHIEFPGTDLAYPRSC
jgi:hypothetical protein